MYPVGVLFLAHLACMDAPSLSAAGTCYVKCMGIINKKHPTVMDPSFVKKCTVMILFCHTAS